MVDMIPLLFSSAWFRLSPLASLPPPPLHFYHVHPSFLRRRIPSVFGRRRIEPNQSSGRISSWFVRKIPGVKNGFLFFFSFRHIAGACVVDGRSLGRVPGDRCTFRPFRPALAKSTSFHSVPFPLWRLRKDFPRCFSSSLNNSGCFSKWIALYSFFFFHCHCSDRSGNCTWVLMYAMFLTYLWWCWCRCLFWPIYSIFQCLCALIPLLVWFAWSLLQLS